MAEIVQSFIERSIQNLSILERNGIFSSTEIKNILAKQKEFEYRLRKVTKSENDFLQYIAYEESLLKLIRVRCSKLGLEVDKQEVEKGTFDHILDLFEFALNKYKFDTQFWLSYIDFAKSVNMMDKITSIYFRMLQVHNKDWVWLQFAKFEFEHKQSSEAARNLFLRCISFHSDSKAVWWEYFKFELLYCAKMRKRLEIINKNSLEKTDLDQDDKVGDIWNGQLAWIVYKHAIDNFADFDFAQQFVEICNRFEYEIALKTKQNIFEDLEERFSYLEDYWNLKAIDHIQQYRQQLRSQHTFTIEQIIEMKKKAYEETFKTFKEACYRFDNDKMWSFYAAFQLSELQESSDERWPAKCAEVLAIFDEIWKTKKLSLPMFEEWIRLLYTVGRNDSHTVQRLTNIILAEGASNWSDNLELHLFIGSMLVKLGEKTSDTIVHKFFDDALLKKRFASEDKEEIKKKIECWDLYLHWCIKKKAFTKLKKLLAEFSDLSIRSPRMLGEHLKTKGLAIVYHCFGIQKARFYYDENKHVTPICKGFFEKMLEIEKHHLGWEEDAERDALPSSVVDVFESMVHHFGQDDYRIWLDYVRLVMPFDVKKASDIYRNALRCLPDDKSLLFREQCSLDHQTFTLSPHY